MKTTLTLTLALATATVTYALPPSVSHGTYALATGDQSVAIGNYTQATAYRSVALGDHSRATGSTSLAILGGQATADNAIAIGGRATAPLTVTVGNSAKTTAAYATAVGVQAQATATAATALGDATVSSALHATAIGTAAQATHNNSVALGNRSQTSAPVATTTATINGHVYTGFAGGTPTATVSVGNDTLKRTVTNVAAGRLTAGSTDAVNGSQLYAVATVASTKTTVSGSRHVTVTRTPGTYDYTIATTGLATTGDIDRVERSLTRAARRAAAQGIAHANVPQVIRAGSSTIGIGVGAYRGQQALAVGYSHASDNGHHIVKLTVSADRSAAAFGGGYSYQY